LALALLISNEGCPGASAPRRASRGRDKEQALAMLAKLGQHVSDDSLEDLDLGEDAERGED
jgi:hypothetical protein